MAKLVKLEQKTFEGKPSGFKITLDDGRTGNLQEKESDKGLREGDNVLVTEIPYTSKAGKTSTLYGLRLNQQNFTPQPQNPTTLNAPSQQNKPSVLQQPSNTQRTIAVPGKSIEEQKVAAAVSATEFVTSMFNAERIDWPKFTEHQRECVQLLWDEIDEIYGKK